MNVKVPCQWPSQKPCRIAFIGEAPSDEEVMFKKPFVGPSGSIFNAILRTAGLERSEYLVTNTFDEQAPDNDVSSWMRDEARCQENFARLNSELMACQPNVIVPLGNTALWALTGHQSIKTFRGSVTKATRVYPDAKLLPTLHPEAVRKDWRFLPVVAADFIKASEEADLGPQITYPKVELLIEPTFEDVQEFAQECFAAPKLAVDIETGWGQITSIAFAPTTSRALSIPFVDLRKPNRNYWASADDEFAVWRVVQAVCESPVPKVLQNGLYDLMWLIEKHGIAVRNYRFDTKLRHKVMFPELPADLASMAGSYTRIGAWKSWGGHYQKEKADG